ncbi:hypothetical protein I6N90_17610 [Paenibacillus sp. GSMTC-2017]|uniref:DUF6463 family protein n=1 Tax=Paenibacillus sp. GSMTC-2017 TaxID=2794350 RepID=UPI0018D89210|nr:hypothetical protein [Paenibacillus sp. GSMTC-2017]
MVIGIKRHVGVMLMLTGLLHTVVVLIFGATQLQIIVAEGFWNTVGSGQGDRDAVFWSLLFGFMIIVTGYMVNWILKHKGIVPPAGFGWILLAVGLIGVIMMPVSGFWLVLPQAVILIRNQPRKVYRLD